MGRNMRYRARFAIVASLLGVTVACGSGKSASVDAGGSEGQDASATLQAATDTGGGGNDAEEAVDGVESDAPTAAQASPAETDAGSFACGTTACRSSQLCVHPCCGGAAPSCMPVPTLGDCPSKSDDGLGLPGDRAARVPGTSLHPGSSVLHRQREPMRQRVCLHGQWVRRVSIDHRNGHHVPLRVSRERRCDGRTRNRP
jgi:hypothetical protein